MHLATKMKGILQRPVDLVVWFPRRLSRLFGHLREGGRRVLVGRGIKAYAVSAWWLESFFLLWDLVGMSEVYEMVADVLKFNSRPLTGREIRLARTIFADALPYHRIRIDTAALAGPPQGRFCYVSFCIINSWGKMNDALLIHELVHIWQYYHWGSVYIPRALAAQRSEAGYDYGGVEKLKFHLESGGLLAFNPEQQADIIADYFRLVTGLPPCWGNAKVADLPIYHFYVQQLIGRE